MGSDLRAGRRRSIAGGSGGRALRVLLVSANRLKNPYAVLPAGPGLCGPGAGRSSPGAGDRSECRGRNGVPGGRVEGHFPGHRRDFHPEHRQYGHTGSTGLYGAVSGSGGADPFPYHGAHRFRGKRFYHFPGRTDGIFAGRLRDHRRGGAPGGSCWKPSKTGTIPPACRG